MLKFIKKQIKKFNKSSSWFKITVALIIIIAVVKLTANKRIQKEGFTQREAYVEKEGHKVYDAFYAPIYDELVADDRKNEYEVNEIINHCKVSKKSKVLDVGAGTGTIVSLLNKKKIPVEGVDISMPMVKYARKKYPGLTFNQGDATKAMLFPANTFTHITCLYFTIYAIEDKITFFKNCYQWLQPGGTLVLNLVNRDKFDPILNVSDPLLWVSPQKHAKKRITNSVVKFKDFQYKANFDLVKKDNLATFTETMKDDATKHVRKNIHKLYMPTQKHILSMAKEVGFILKGKVHLVPVQYEYQYLYFLYK